MSKTTIQRKSVAGSGSALRTHEQRAAILRRNFGAWKGPLKKSLRTLSTLRRGWNRKVV